YRMLRAIQDADRVRESAMEEDGATVGVVTVGLTPEAADAKLGDRLGTAAVAMAMSLMRTSSAVDHARDPAESPEEAVGKAELAALLRAAIAERPEAERRLLERHYFDDVTIDEAARELGLSKSWGSRLHARAVEAVARSLKRSRVRDR